MDLSVCVGTFGSQRWPDLAARRAIPSAEALNVPVFHVHADTLAGARNGALARVETEWVAFLDADDELTPGFVDAMETASADMRAPALQQVWNRRARRPFMPQVYAHTHECVAECLIEGSWLVIGTVVRTGLVREVGAFWDEPVYEDWSLFLRCYLAGGTVEAVPEAIYRAYANPEGRNRALRPRVRNEWHHRILVAAREQAEGRVAA